MFTMPGLDRIGVKQSSGDEFLDQKNAFERCGRTGRVFEGDKLKLRADINRLTKRFIEKFFKFADVDDEWFNVDENLSGTWFESRTGLQKKRFFSSERFLETAKSVAAYCFLKTQTKVKMDASFALESNYGQTVLASSPGECLQYGDQCRRLQINLMRACRTGIIVDCGLSDREMLDHANTIGISEAFAVKCTSLDISKQDSSHGPTTLGVFANIAKFLGCDPHLIDLYVERCTVYSAASLKPGLYRMDIRGNLGSGDPFTLIRNIIECMTKLVHDFDIDDGSIHIIKGDNITTNDSLTPLVSFSDEIKSIVLGVDAVDIPIHAGRFFFDNRLYPDPVRRVGKLLCADRTSDDREAELTLAWFDMYVPYDDYAREKIFLYCSQMYNTMPSEIVREFVNLYCYLDSRDRFGEFLGSDKSNIYIYNPKKDCFSSCVRKYFNIDSHVDLSFIDDMNERDCKRWLNARGVKYHDVTKSDSDYAKTGFWFGRGHVTLVYALSVDTKTFEKKKLL
jgi:hypothetical protein